MTFRQHEAIMRHVAGMMALEDQLAAALTRQIERLEDQPGLLEGLRAIQDTSVRHLKTLDVLFARRMVGGEAAAVVVQRVVRSLQCPGSGVFAGVRTDRLSDNMRTDYAVVSLACIGYLMLHTTAEALEDDEVADVAHQHLAAHATSIASLHRLVPVAVVGLLRSEGHTVNDPFVRQGERHIPSMWQ